MKGYISLLFLLILFTQNDSLSTNINRTSETTSSQQLLILINDFAHTAAADDPSLLSLASAIRLRIPAIVNTELVQRYLFLREHANGNGKHPVNVQKTTKALQRHLDTYHKAVHHKTNIAHRIQQAREGETLIAAARMQQMADKTASEKERSRLMHCAQDAARETIKCLRMHYQNKVILKTALRNIHTDILPLTNVWPHDEQCELTRSWRIITNKTNNLCFLWPQELPIRLPANSLNEEVNLKSNPYKLPHTAQQTITSTHRNLAQSLLNTIEQLTQATKQHWLVAVDGHGSFEATPHAPCTFFAGMPQQTFQQFISGLHKLRTIAALVISTCYGGGQHAQQIAHTLEQAKAENGYETPFGVAILATASNPTTCANEDIVRCADSAIAHNSQLAYAFELAKSLEQAPEHYPTLVNHHIADTSIPLIRRHNDTSFRPHPAIATILHDHKKRTGACEKQSRAFYLSTTQEISTPITLRASAPYNLPFFVSNLVNKPFHRLSTVNIQSKYARTDETRIAHQLCQVFNRLNTPSHTTFKIRNLRVGIKGKQPVLLENVQLETKRSNLHADQRTLTALFTRDGCEQQLHITSEAKTAEPVSVELATLASTPPTYTQPPQRQSS